MKGKVIIVTGASRGLGAAAARAAATFGARLTLTARSRGDLERVVAEIQAGGGEALIVPGDLSEPATAVEIVEATEAAYGRIDGLINNAGVIAPIAPVSSVNPEAWAGNLRVNLIAPAQLTAVALPALRRASGIVVNVSSGAAVGVVEGWAAYCAAKAALNHYTHVLAAEEPQVTALSFRPGVVDTGMQAEIRQTGASGMPADVHQRFVLRHDRGELLPAERPGRSLAALTLLAPREWSGDFLAWDEERVQALIPLARSTEGSESSDLKPPG